jgi:hypothetical protein
MFEIFPKKSIGEGYITSKCGLFQGYKDGFNSENKWSHISRLRKKLTGALIKLSSCHFF